MGTTIKAKYEGRCKMCGSNWGVGDDIFYQRTPKAICQSKECFKEQGGSLFDQQTFNGSRNESIVTKLPDCQVSDDIKKLTEIGDQLFVTAHYWTKDRYPAEEVTSDRFGRIRSQNMSFLIQLYKIVYKD
jgi:hypothetical protein